MGSIINTPSGAAQEIVLREVVKDLARKAGVPAPDIYLWPHENGINSMSAGLSPDDAAIMVTKGVLKYLNREEISGVIANEMTHIATGDTRRNSLIAGWLFGFYILTIMGTRLAKSQTEGPPALFALFLLGMGFFGGLLGQLIQSLLNRPRVSLADKRSLRLTGDQPYLAQALKKIGGLDQLGYLNNEKTHRPDTRHFFLTDCSKTKIPSHPDLAKRIWALEPNWDGHWPDFTAKPIDFLSDNPYPTP
jgi:Zn-dependent protease with chaperone function